LDVDIAAYTLTVATEFAKKPFTSISFATPYQHFNNGEGIYFMPEVGSLCWVCEPSDGNMPFVLAWAAAQDEGDFSSRKQQLNPGDIYLGTRDENFLILRRGGVVQIGGTGLCQRMFLPINNTIRDFCENYSLQTLGGDLSWSVDIPEGTTDGKRPTKLVLNGRVRSNDQNPTATLQIGSHDNDDKTILSLSIKASGDQGAQEEINLKLGNDGTIQWTVQSDITYNIQGNFTVTAKGDVNLDSQGNFEASGQQGVNISTPQQATLKGSAGVTLDAPLVQTTQMLSVGGSSGMPVALAPVLLVWLASHLHTCTIPGSQGSPPVVPPPGSIASTMLTSAG
jgi:hypothetical protein